MRVRAALARRGDRDSLEALLRWAEPGNHLIVRLYAIHWLGALRALESQPMLLDILRDHPAPPHREIYRMWSAAAFALKHLGTSEAMTALLRSGRFRLLAYESERAPLPALWIDDPPELSDPDWAKVDPGWDDGHDQ